MRCHKYKGGSEFKKALIGHLEGIENFKIGYQKTHLFTNLLICFEEGEMRHKFKGRDFLSLM